MHDSALERVDAENRRNSQRSRMIDRYVGETNRYQSSNNPRTRAHLELRR